MVVFVVIACEALTVVGADVDDGALMVVVVVVDVTIGLASGCGELTDDVYRLRETKIN